MEEVLHEDLRDNFLQCRTLGHAWYPGSTAHLDGAGEMHWWMVVQCERCGTDRTDLVDERTGDVDRRKYNYPEGYQIDETVVRSQLRVEWARRKALGTTRIQYKRRVS